MLRRRPEVIALAALLVLYASWLALSWIPGDPQKLHILFLAPVDALVVYASWRASQRSASIPWLRTFWLLVMAAWAAELGADLIFAFDGIVLEDLPFPSLADPFFLAFYPLMLGALLRVPTLKGIRSQRIRTGFDCATVVVGAGSVIWYFVLGPILVEGGGSLSATAVSLAYPVGDILLIGLLSLVLFRGGPSAIRSPLRLLAVGLLMLIAADIIYGHQQLHGTYSVGDPVDTLYVLMAVPFVLAAAAQVRAHLEPVSKMPTLPRDLSSRAGRLPLVTMVVGLAVLLATQRHDKFFPELSLLIFLLVLCGLSVIRQYVAQTELVQLRDRTRTIVESVADGIVTFSEAGVIIWVNPAAEAAFRVARGELEGTPVDALFHGVDWKQMAPLLGIGTADGNSVIGKRRTLAGERRDGTTFPLEMIVTDARLDGERVLIAIGQDVGERERAATELRDSERRFRGIFDHAGVGIAFSVFEEGMPHVVDVNAAFSAMIGYSLDELRGDDFSMAPIPTTSVCLPKSAWKPPRARITSPANCAAWPRTDRSSGGRCPSRSCVTTKARRTSPSGCSKTSPAARRWNASRTSSWPSSATSCARHSPRSGGRWDCSPAASSGEPPDGASGMVTMALASTDRLVRLVNDILDIERMDPDGPRSRSRRSLRRSWSSCRSRRSTGSATAADVVLGAEVEDASSL